MKLSYPVYRLLLRWYMILSSIICLFPIVFAISFFGVGIPHLVFLFFTCLPLKSREDINYLHLIMVIYYALLCFLVWWVMPGIGENRFSAITEIGYIRFGLISLPYLLPVGILLLVPQFLYQHQPFSKAKVSVPDTFPPVL